MKRLILNTLILLLEPQIIKKFHWNFEKSGNILN
jgi:hypothetical protein